jgi:hypothetical protein
MSERFGIPDHSPQHAPDHALQNPTPIGSSDSGPTGSEWPSGTPTYTGGGQVDSGSLGGLGSYRDPTRKIKTAIILAMLFGPLGLFYVGFLHGLVALFIVVPAIRPIALAAFVALGGKVDRLLIIIPMMWCITVPWAIFGSQWHNRKLNPNRP